MTMWKSLVALAVALPALSHPVSLIKRADEIDDTSVLNFALTLEHLENAFYSGGLAKFDAEAFTAAGLPAYVRGRFEQVAAHEKAHVDLLTTALGDNATQACEYEFAYTDVASFVALSQILEGVGTSAYIGAASLITNKDYLTVAASILSTEARHAGWVASSVNKHAGWSGPYDTPLTVNEVYTLAFPFIASCPDSNPVLPATAYPAITVSPLEPLPGSEITLSFSSGDSTGGGSESTSTSIKVSTAKATSTKTSTKKSTSSTAKATSTKTSTKKHTSSTAKATSTKTSTHTSSTAKATSTKTHTKTHTSSTVKASSTTSSTENPTSTVTSTVTLSASTSIPESSTRSRTRTSSGASSVTSIAPSSVTSSSAASSVTVTSTVQPSSTSSSDESITSSAATSTVTVTSTSSEPDTATSTTTTSESGGITVTPRRRETNEYAVFLSGLDKYSVPITDGKVTIPADLKGTVYVVVSSGNGTDAEIIAGPAVLTFNFDSDGTVV